MFRNAVSLIVLATIVTLACGAAYGAWPLTVQAEQPEALLVYDPLP
jgi:hypothetical protein